MWMCGCVCVCFFFCHSTEFGLQCEQNACNMLNVYNFFFLVIIIYLQSESLKYVIRSNSGEFQSIESIKHRFYLLHQIYYILVYYLKKKLKCLSLSGII